jgi:4-amino-4-deoxy-L-arabinose transferase-like glycosyltransferase
MRSDARRAIRPQVYAIFFLIFAIVVFASHGAFLALPYFWDEAGQFVPAALDILRGGWFIPHSIAPNVHPPGVMLYLAASWRMLGYSPETTRCAMLLLAALGVLAAFLLSIELSRETRGSPAFLAAALLCASPLFVAQSMLAQLDAPAMLFTACALLLFLQDRIALCAAVCVGLVVVKETGLIVPVVFALWLSKERRWRDAALFLGPVAALGFWLVALKLRTGNWAGNAEFVQYNLFYPLAPLRLAAAFLRRIYYLFFADLHWVGAVAIFYAWRRSRIFHTRSWRVAWLLAAAHVAMFTVLGGAVLERYLLPVLPILYAGIAAALTVYSRWARTASTAALLL